MLAWHFLSEDKRLGYGDGRLVEVGATLECEGKPELCVNGLHGSARIIDALKYASGPIVCRVEIEGDIVKGEDKLCGRRRTVLWMLDATRILHEFACQCAEDAMTLVERPDERSVAAIEAKRRWLKGEIKDKELDAASDAAWAARAAAWAAADAAAYAAARSAACAAARDARAADAAADAADAAAYSAAYSAAWAAAHSAAVWNAECAAARDDARAKQNERLTAMVMEAHEKEGE